MFYILDDNKQVVTAAMEQFSLFMRNKENKIVAQENFGDDLWVSTVFLGIDHGFGNTDEPIVFETMIFPQGGPLNEMYCERYTSYEDALAGHSEIIGRLTNGWDPRDDSLCLED